MSVAAVLTMITILTFVWGGFLLALGLGISRERRKRRAGRPDGPPSTPG